MLHTLLAQLGFNDKETTIYLAILEKGRATPTEIAKITGINRTTVYSVAKELISRRIISEDLGSPTRQLVAQPPEELRQLLAKEQEKIEKSRSIVESAIGELQKIAKSTAFAVPKIVYVPEADLASYLYKRSAAWNESIVAADKIWWGFQDTTFVEHYGEWIKWYWKESAPPSVRLQLLSNSARAEREMQKNKISNRVIKFWKGGAQFSGTLWVTGDFLLMIITSAHPHYLIEINDATLASNMRELFKGIWKTL